MEIAGGACDKAAKGVVVVVVRLSSLYVAAAAAAPLIPQSVVGRAHCYADHAVARLSG